MLVTGAKAGFIQRSLGYRTTVMGPCTGRGTGLSCASKKDKWGLVMKDGGDLRMGKHEGFWLNWSAKANYWGSLKKQNKTGRVQAGFLLTWASTRTEREPGHYETVNPGEFGCSFGQGPKSYCYSTQKNLGNIAESLPARHIDGFESSSFGKLTVERLWV